VPDPLRDNERVAVAQLHEAFAVREFEPNRDRARHQEQQLVAVGMHFTVVRRVPSEFGRPDAESVNAMRWLARLLLHELSPPVAPPDADHGGSQLERLTDRNLHARMFATPQRGFASRARIRSMALRRVVTGHTSDGRAVVVSDGVVDLFPIGDQGTGANRVWASDQPGDFPDHGAEPQVAKSFPPIGGCACSVMELAPEGDDFHNFVSTALAEWADPNEPGMHRTATLDYDIVMEGIVGLELDDGAEVLLHAGDVVVQNGTRHRWHNRGTTIARIISVTVGAHNRLVESVT
jgi:mannose-6-phosphate isomerase-like protein (cupin superfamily)